MNCVIPGYMLPLGDQTSATNAMLGSSAIVSALSERELAEVERLMVCSTSTGAVLTMDRDATQAANAKRKAAAAAARL
jgi:hypothetical protein